MAGKKDPAADSAECRELHHNNVKPGELLLACLTAFQFAGNCLFSQ